jgi:phage N-6-adenine-methyltransferase
MRQLIKTQHGSITIYDPEKALQTIAIAEIGEKHWARAKDATQLFEAIETKIRAQAEYVVWRDHVVPHGGVNQHNKRKIAAPKSSLPAADPGDVTAHRWRQRLCRKNGQGTEIDEQKLAAALNDARLRSVRICEQQNVGVIRGTQGTGEFERYTPRQYIEAAREVLGVIDLDPATCAAAQKWIGAKKFYTAETNGLAQQWHGNVWLNPPYHRELAPRFIEKLIVELTLGRVEAAIMLTNNCTDTDWFDVALRACASICFTRGRIEFIKPDGDVTGPGPTQGQAFFYFGKDIGRFEAVFCAIGSCLRPSRCSASWGGRENSRPNRKSEQNLRLGHGHPTHSVHQGRRRPAEQTHLAQHGRLVEA